MIANFRLDTYTTDLMYRRTRQVTDPASLLSWDEDDEGVTTAMEKALGAWLITAE